MKKLILVICLCCISVEIYLLPIVQYINNVQGKAYYKNCYTYIGIAPYSIAFLIPLIIIVSILINEIMKRWIRPWIQRIEEQ